MIVFIVLRVCRYLALNYGKTGNKSVQLVLQPCCKTSWIAMLRVLPATNQTVLNQIRLMQFAKSCCGKKRVLLFATKSVHVTRFTVQYKLALQQVTYHVYFVSPVFTLTNCYTRGLNVTFQLVFQQCCYIQVKGFCFPFNAALFMSSIHK